MYMQKGISISSTPSADVGYKRGDISAFKVNWMKQWRINAFPETTFYMYTIQRSCESEWV